MTAALVLEPNRVEWRNLLIDWLLAWGRPEVAHDAALVGLHYRPNDPCATGLWSEPPQPLLAVIPQLEPCRNLREPGRGRRPVATRECLEPLVALIPIPRAESTN